MATIAKTYGNALLQALLGKVNWSTDAIKVSLHTSAYIPDQDNHVFQSSLTNEVVGTGYTAGGAILANKTINYTGSTNVIALSGDPVSWSSSTITARYAVIYDSTPGTSATNVLLGYIDFGSDVSSTNGNFTLSWDSGGIFNITVS